MIPHNALCHLSSQSSLRIQRDVLHYLQFCRHLEEGRHELLKKDVAIV